MNRDVNIVRCWCIVKLGFFNIIFRQTVCILYCRKLLKQKIDNCSRDLEFLRKRLDDIRMLTEHSKIEKFTAITREGDEADDDYSMVGS